MAERDKSPEGPRPTHRNSQERIPNDDVRRVGGPRNEHGTRVARRVECRRCKKSDHVAWIPRDKEKALCRECAGEVLKAYEFGVRPKNDRVTHECTVCLASFELPPHIEDDGELCCQNCLRGFMAWSGKVGTPIKERVHSEERPGGTRLRKKPAKKTSPDPSE